IPLTQVPIKGDYARRDFARSARFHAVEGFRMPSTFPIATQAPARIVLWMKARDPGRVAAVVHGLYRAFFAEDVDISKPDAAAAVDARHGADELAVRAAIDDPVANEQLEGEEDRLVGARF